MATDPAPARRVARRHRPAHLALLTVLCAGLAVYAWLVAAAAPFSHGALVGVLIPGAVLGAGALTALVFAVIGGEDSGFASPSVLSLLGLSAVAAAAFFEWEASAWRDNSWPWHPSFTNLVDPLLAPHLIKSAAILVWLLAGWALVRR